MSSLALSTRKTARCYRQDPG